MTWCLRDAVTAPQGCSGVCQLHALNFHVGEGGSMTSLAVFLSSFPIREFFFPSCVPCVTLGQGWTPLGVPWGLHCQEPWEGWGSARPGQPSPARIQTPNRHSTKALNSSQMPEPGAELSPVKKPLVMAPTSHQKQSGSFSVVCFSEKYFP